MSRARKHACKNCGKRATPERHNYRYAQSGLSNLILQGIDVADCPNCGNSDVLIPRMAKIHRAIAQALTNSPVRLTGEQLRFLRKHLGLSGDQLGRYLHTDRTKISKRERGEDRIGPARTGWSGCSRQRLIANYVPAFPRSRSIFRRSRTILGRFGSCMST
jgi:hypothetical protein